MTRDEARRQRAAEITRQRGDAALCAWDFLTRPGHENRCVKPGGVLCSRDYDPGPKPEDERLYEGSALGALWGMNEIAVWQLAGWNVRRRRDS